MFGLAGMKITRIKSVEGRADYGLVDLLPIIQLPKEALIIDGGANEGQTVKLLLQHQKTIFIKAFEPDPGLYSLLLKKYTNTEQVELFDYALTDENKNYEFNRYRANKLSSIKTLNPNSNQSSVLESTFQVKGKTIDKLMHERQFETIDLLKLDLQGFEYEALLGARKALSNGSINWIFLELMFGDMYLTNENNNNLFKILTLLNKNYDLYSMVDFNYQQNLKFSHCDILFRKRQI